MKTCNLFDKYRDGEVSALDRERYELHLAECPDCRAKTTLINNLTCVLRREQVQLPIDLSVRIARRAFQQNKSWDALVIGWLRPASALAVLALVLVLSSVVWFVPDYSPLNAYSEYETLMNEADAVNLDSSYSKINSDSELMFWLEQKEYSR
jgi:hypothetical protein